MDSGLQRILTVTAWRPAANPRDHFEGTLWDRDSSKPQLLDLNSDRCMPLIHQIETTDEGLWNELHNSKAIYVLISTPIKEKFTQQKRETWFKRFVDLYETWFMIVTTWTDKHIHWCSSTARLCWQHMPPQRKVDLHFTFRSPSRPVLRRKWHVILLGQMYPPRK